MNLKHYGLSLLAAMTAFFATAQDFSNKGKEFWLAYSYHVGMGGTAGNQPVMTLYITSDLTTPYRVEIFGGATIQTGNIVAGQVVSVNIPNTYFINNEGLFTAKAIRVTADQPVVVYSYITRAAASGATLCLPVTVLGKEYYTSNFTQISNEQNSNSYFTIVAVEDNTTVEITPAATTKNGRAAGTPFTVNLNKGEIYQVLGARTSLVNGIENGTDLTGSRIRSIASGNGGCKRIAVFSGSGKIFITATSCTQNSSDNLYQQLYPVGSWGLKYLTVPSYNRTRNIYRIIRSDPATNVYLNGTLVPPASFTNNYYQFTNNTANSIQADKPISVAQYFTTQGCDGNPSPYDPDMIILNPVEQNINKVTLVSSNLYATPTSNHQHHIHVIMRNGGTGMSSFRLDGANVPLNNWVTHPSDPTYSYLYLNNVTQGYHTIQSDSSFNAIAYGYANAESYGYSAGANVKDLYQFASIKNEYAQVDFPATCTNAPFHLRMIFPYEPNQIRWVFGTALNAMGFSDVTINTPTYDSTWVVNGRQLYRYTLPGTYSATTTGTYPIKVFAQNPTPDGCSGEQEINYDLQVYSRPVADFNFTSSGCVSDSVRFNDVSNTNGRNAYQWGWNFDDGTKSALQNPAHLFSNSGTFNIKFALITDIGCISDSVTKQVALSPAPLAKFGISTPYCVGKPVNFTDSSTSAQSSIVRWIWNFGDGAVVTATTNAPQTHTYATAGNFNATLLVETASGCKSTIFSKTITVSPLPVPAFTFGNACLPAGTMTFTNQTTIPDGTALTYYWDFGDGATSTQTSPSHNYTAVGPVDVKLLATSTTGCSESIVKPVNTIYAQPQAAFTAPAEICLGGTASFTDQSTAPNSTTAQWNWDFGDGQVSTQQNPAHVYAAAGTYTVTLRTTSAIGCLSLIATRTIVVNSLPTTSIVLPATTCVTRNLVFSEVSAANSGSLTQWNWNMGDGTAYNRTSNNPPLAHTYTATGTYNVTLQVQSDKGCVSTVATRQVMVHPLPEPGFIMPGNCLTDPFTQFTDTSKIADGTQAQFTYQWNFGDQNATPPLNPNTSTVKNPQHKYTAVGNYNVTLSVTSVNGCTSSVTQLFTINGTTPQSNFSIQGGNQQCSNKTVTLVNGSTVDFGNVVQLEIYWDYTGDPTNKTVVSNPPAGSTYSHTYPEFFTPASVNYTVRVVAYSGTNCLSTTSQTVTMQATPQVVFNAVPPVCADAAPFQITQAGISNALPGAGVYSGTGVSPTGVFNPQVAGPGTHNIRFTYTGTNGCSNYKEQTITVFTVPSVTAGPDRFMLEGGFTTLLGVGNGNNVSYQWTPATSLNDATIAQPTATPNDDITYRLTVISEDGCRASDEVFVKALKGPSIPNVFTPNGDGINDKWDIQYLDTYPGATVQVFNRYGQKVFESKGYTKAWDGTKNGKPVPTGTYYYIVDPKNGRTAMSGFVDILR